MGHFKSLVLCFKIIWWGKSTVRNLLIDEVAIKNLYTCDDTLRLTGQSHSEVNMVQKKKKNILCCYLKYSPLC